jgi:hypothetical protein
VQVQRILDAQQFFLHCAADGIEQLAVARSGCPGHGPARLGGGDALSGAASSTLSLTPSSPRARGFR